MTNNIYTLRDTLSNRFGQVFVFATDELCLYTLRKAIPLSDVSKYIRQYEVVKVGTMDAETAEIRPLPHSILNWEECPMLDIIEHDEQALTKSSKPPIIGS